MSDEEKRNAEPVPYFIHEGMMQRMSENNRRLLIALIVSLVVSLSALLIDNFMWHEFQKSEKEVVYEETNP
jgi:hypothetical protein